jgi:hypothetical protein
MNFIKSIVRALVNKRVAKRLKRSNSSLAKYFSKKK